MKAQTWLKEGGPPLTGAKQPLTGGAHGERQARGGWLV